RAPAAGRRSRRAGDLGGRRAPAHRGQRPRGARPAGRSRAGDGVHPSAGAPVSDNPFPGPQPYRTRDRQRFFGREDLAARLLRGVLAHGILTVYGPSGAGKSSLLAAAVLPALVGDYDVRVVSVDRWPEGVAPLSWLLDAMVDQLALGSEPEGGAPVELLA